MDIYTVGGENERWRDQETAEREKNRKGEQQNRTGGRGENDERMKIENRMR